MPSGVKSEPKFKCRVCDKNFAHNQSRHRHEQKHKGKRFRCKCCNRSYTRSDTLLHHRTTKLHLRRVQSRRGNQSATRQPVNGTELARSPSIVNSLLRPGRRTNRQRSPPRSTHQTVGNGIVPVRSPSIDSIRLSGENADDFEFNMLTPPNRTTSSDLASSHLSTLSHKRSALERSRSCTPPLLTSGTSSSDSTPYPFCPPSPVPVSHFSMNHSSPSPTSLTQIDQPSSRLVPTTGNEDSLLLRSFSLNYEQSNQYSSLMARNESPANLYKLTLQEYNKRRWSEGDEKLLKYSFWRNMPPGVRKGRFQKMMEQDGLAKYEFLPSELNPSQRKLFKRSVEEIEAELKKKFIEFKLDGLTDFERQFIENQLQKTTNLEDFLIMNRSLPLYPEILEFIYQEKLLKYINYLFSKSALAGVSTTQASAPPGTSVVQKTPSISLPNPVMHNLAISHETVVEDASDQSTPLASLRRTSKSSSSTSEGTGTSDSTRSSTSRPTPTSLAPRRCQNSTTHDDSEPRTVPPSKTHQVKPPAFRDVYDKNDESMNNVSRNSLAKSTVVASKKHLKMQSVVTSDKQPGLVERAVRPVVHSTGNTLMYLNGDPVEEEVVNGNHGDVIQMAIRGRGPALLPFQTRDELPISHRCQFTKQDVDSMRKRDQNIDDNALFVIAFEKTGAYNTNLRECDQIRLIHPALAHLLLSPQSQDIGDDGFDFESILRQHEAFTGSSKSRRVAFPMRLPAREHFVLVMIGIDRDDWIRVHILDSSTTDPEEMPMELIKKLARHYFGERELAIEEGSRAEVEWQGATVDCGIHTILNLTRYFNDSHRFLGRMDVTMKITESFGKRIMDFRKEWANRLDQILSIEMPALHNRFAGNNSLIPSQVHSIIQSNTLDVVENDVIVLDDGPSDAKTSPPLFTVMSVTLAQGSENAENHFYVLSENKKFIEILKEGNFDRNSREIFGQVPEDVMNRIGKKITYRNHVMDKHIGCIKCNVHYEVCCGKHPLFWVENLRKDQGDRSIPYADRSIPEKFFKLSNETIAGWGVVAKRRIPAGMVFGPYEGVLTTESKCANPNYSWIIKIKKTRRNVDGFDKEKGNWMRYINSPNEEKDKNMFAFQHEGQMYYRTIKSIPKGSEALVWYGRAFGKQLQGQRESQ